MEGRAGITGSENPEGLSSHLQENAEEERLAVAPERVRVVWGGGQMCETGLEVVRKFK